MKKLVLVEAPQHLMTNDLAFDQLTKGELKSIAGGTACFIRGCQCKGGTYTCNGDGNCTDNDTTK